ncbi:hypothetical protein BDW59DRAFT_160321 [Aspergillus cavernicola]|uniref:DUF1963 domain-containing protein n=1 Tax=Aspergillus cavernicola TaxID=176166 RepID=A0ABR4IHX1_9EURO
MHAQILADGIEEFHFRLDVYFLPNASNEDCIAHYQAEKAIRGDFMQMRQDAEQRLDANLPPPDQPTPRLPGMINIYSPIKGLDLSELLFIHPDRSWRDGAQRMCYITYGPGFELGQPFGEGWYGFEVGDDDESLGLYMWECSRPGWEETLGVYQHVAVRGWTSW